MDLSPVHKWPFRADALIASQRVHSNNVLGLNIGQIGYGCFCNARGRLVANGTVYKFSDEFIWVVTNTPVLADKRAEAT